jgi:integrase
MGAKEVSEFLTHLAVEGHVAASTQNQALSGLLFLYREVLERDFGGLDDVVRAKKPKHLPVVFTPEEAMGVIGELSGRRWLMGMQLYGGGLRLNECLRQRVKDLDFERLQVTVRDGKGEKDRVTLLPEAIVEPLKEHLVRVRQAHERALSDGYAGVDLPYALA